MDDDRERHSGKRDRLARLARLVAFLQAHPEGVPIKDIAKRVDMSVRTVYRDLQAIEGELRLPIWGEDGVWGIDSAKAFLPPLKLTQQEAMAVVLSARLMVRYVDKYDPDLAAAFEKLERGLPPAARGARRADAGRAVEGAARRALQRARPAPHSGLGGAAGRHDRLRAGPLRGGAVPRRRDRPTVPDRTLAPDPRALPDRLRRGPRRAPDVQDRADPDRGADAADLRTARRRPTRPPRSAGPGTSSRTSRRPTSCCDSRRPSPTVSARRRWHPSQAVEPEPDGSLRWSGNRLGHHRGPPLDPVVGRRRRGPGTGVVARRRGRHAPAGGSALRGGRRMRRLAGLGLALAVLLATVPADERGRRPDDLEHLVLDQVNAARVERGLAQAAGGTVRCGISPATGPRGWQPPTSCRTTVAGSLEPGLHCVARQIRLSRTWARPSAHVRRTDGGGGHGARDAVAEQPAALGAAHERELQLRRRRAGVSVGQRAAVRVGRADGVEGSFRRACRGHRGDPDGRRHPVAMDGLGYLALQTHTGGAARHHRPDAARPRRVGHDRRPHDAHVTVVTEQGARSLVRAAGPRDGQTRQHRAVVGGTARLGPVTRHSRSRPSTSSATRSTAMSS